MPLLKRRRLGPLASAPASWHSLSDEVKLMIFRFLPETDLLKASGVAKDWYRLACDDGLWRALLHDRFTDSVWQSAPAYPGEPVKARYARLIRFRRLLSQRRKVTQPVEFAVQGPQIVGIEAVDACVITLSTDGHMRAYDVVSTKLVAVSTGVHSEKPLQLLRVLPRGIDHKRRIRHIAVSLDSQEALIWKTPELELLAVLPHPGLLGARLAPDARRLLTWSSDQAVCWDVDAAVVDRYRVSLRVPESRHSLRDRVIERLRDHQMLPGSRGGSTGSRSSSRRKKRVAQLQHMSNILETTELQLQAVPSSPSRRQSRRASASVGSGSGQRRSRRASTSAGSRHGSETRRKRKRSASRDRGDHRSSSGEIAGGPGAAAAAGSAGSTTGGGGGGRGAGDALASPRRPEILRYHVSEEAEEIRLLSDSEVRDSWYWRPSEFSNSVQDAGFLRSLEVVIVTRHAVRVWAPEQALDGPPGIVFATKPRSMRIPWAPVRMAMLHADVGIVLTVRTSQIMWDMNNLTPDTGAVQAIRLEDGVCSDPSNPQYSLVLPGHIPYWWHSDGQNFYLGVPFSSIVRMRYDPSVNTGTIQQPPEAEQEPPLFAMTLTLDLTVIPGAFGNPEARWWRNQGLHLIANGLCFSSPAGRVETRHTNGFPRDDVFDKSMSRESARLEHFPLDEYPYIEAEEEEKRVCVAVSVPYIFTAGGPTHSLKRWDFSRPGDESFTRRAALLKAQQSRVYRYLPRAGMAFILTCLLATWICWQLRLDEIISPKVPYWQVWMPYWVAVSSILVFTARQAFVMQAMFPDIDELLGIAVFAVVLTTPLTFTPLAGVLKVDGIIDVTWSAVFAPVTFLLGVVALIIVGVELVEYLSAQPEQGMATIEGDFVLHSIAIGGFLFFINFFGAALDYTKHAPISGVDTFWFLWSVNILLTAWWVLCMLAYNRHKIVLLFRRHLLRQADATAPPDSWGNLWPGPLHHTSRAHQLLTVTQALVLGLVFTFEWLAYTKLYFDDPDDPLSYARVFVPLDILFAVLLLALSVAALKSPPLPAPIR